MKAKILFPALIFLLFSLNSQSQDAHLSQFYATPIILNPSLTGMQDHGDIRVASQFRNQWNSVANKISTTILAIDMPLQQRWGIGGYIMNYDAAKAFNVFTMVVSGAYDIASSHQKKHKINMGMQLGIINKSTNKGELVFDNQYVDGTFNTDLPNGENIPRMSKIMPEISYGISYINIEHNKKVQPYGGISIFHLTNPRESFLDDKTSRLPLRYVLNGGGKINASDELVIDAKLLAMRQRNAMEINVGASCEYAIQPGTVSLMGGMYYRHKDAVIPMIGVDYKSILLRMTYDINISPLKEYSRGRGGIEFSLVFIGGKQHHGHKH